MAVATTTAVTATVAGSSGGGGGVPYLFPRPNQSRPVLAQGFFFFFISDQSQTQGSFL